LARKIASSAEIFVEADLCARCGETSSLAISRGNRSIAQSQATQKSHRPIN
jgi:SpoVK/Ycf46/Vps4 family AAA+-type ATPase